MKVLKGKEKILCEIHLFMKSQFLSLLRTLKLTQKKRVGKRKKSAVQQGIHFLFSLWVNFLSFFSCLRSQKVCCSHLKSQVLTLIVNLNNREKKTSKTKRINASNLVNWLKCFENIGYFLTTKLESIEKLEIM